MEKEVAGGVFERCVLSKAEETSHGIPCSHVVAVYGASDSWKQTFVSADEIDAVTMLEQKDVLDFDSDGNTTELTRSFYHANALGSVMAISDMNQAVAVSFRYDPYGKVAITRNGQPQSSDPLGQHWGFTGRFLDEETGLFYYRARYYDCTVGRFLQRDPEGLGGGPNLYSYCSSRPTALVDPSGHFAGVAAAMAFKRCVDQARAAAKTTHANTLAKLEKNYKTDLKQALMLTFGALEKLTDNQLSAWADSATALEAAVTTAREGVGSAIAGFAKSQGLDWLAGAAGNIGLMDHLGDLTEAAIRRKAEGEKAADEALRKAQRQAIEDCLPKRRRRFSRVPPSQLLGSVLAPSNLTSKAFGRSPTGSGWPRRRECAQQTSGGSCSEAAESGQRSWGGAFPTGPKVAWISSREPGDAGRSTLGSLGTLREVNTRENRSRRRCAR